MKFYKSLADESPFPYEDIPFFSECQSASIRSPPLRPYVAREETAQLMHFSTSQNKFQSDIRISSMESNNLVIAYVLLIHEKPEQAIRLINSLQEQQHWFVVHVDKRAVLSYNHMKNYSNNMANVFILPPAISDNLNWGGFSIVNATLRGMRFLSALNKSFDYLINLSGTTYPLKSNKRIREALAADSQTVYMDAHNEPFRPHPEFWSYFVECDSALHRIGRLPLPRGLNLYLGSQWFAFPHSIVNWLLHDPLPLSFQSYSKHTVVADETYFSTMFRNSPFCDSRVKGNLLFVKFGKWENERVDRDEKKCLSPDPNTCGRSPLTLTLKDKDELLASPALFARKFDMLDESSSAMLQLIDKNRFP
jgi:hypothetical protein